MSSKLGINQHKIKSLKIGIHILVVLILGSITIPAQATSLKNIPFAKQLEPNKHENNTSLNTQLIQLVPNKSNLFSKNSESKNELKSRLLEQVNDAIDEVQKANQVSQENINGQDVYFYNIKTIKPVALGNNTNISGTNQIRWQLSVPKPRRKIPEPSTGIGLVLAFLLFAARYRLKHLQKF